MHRDPLILGGYSPVSLRQLVQYLIDNQCGAVNNLPGVTNEAVLDAARTFVDTLVSDYMKAKGKRMVVLKTPDDAANVLFLLQFLPNGRYIHICRDGRDVACSTIGRKDTKLGQGIRGYGKLSAINAIHRWCEWETHLRSTFASNPEVSHMFLTYENLVFNPERELRRVCDYLNINYEASMLDYSLVEHDLPDWEAGSTDVKSKKSLDTTSVGRWKRDLSRREMKAIDRYYSADLIRLGYGPCLRSR